MINKEILKDTKSQLSVFMRILDEAINLPEEDIEFLSINGMRRALDKEHYGLLEQIYDLEYQLQRARKVGV